MTYTPSHPPLARAGAAALLCACAFARAEASQPQPQRPADAVAQAAREGTPVFDREAARGTVRSLVRKGELGDGGMPRAQAPDRPGLLSTRADYQLKLARGIEEARRGDCKKA